MARVSAINFQKLNRGILNDGPAKETWAKLTINKKLTDVLDCLDEAETCMVAAKEYIVSSKEAIESVKTFISMAQVDVGTAEECIVESERRIRHLKSEMDSKYKYLFCQNSKFLSNAYSGREERLECSSRNKTLDRSILGHKLDTIEKGSTDSDLNLENCENIKYKVYEDGAEISVIPKETTQSSLKTKSSLIHGSMDSLDECNPVNEDCELDSPKKSSNYLNVGPFKVSKDYFKESRDNFCSEIYREENHDPQPTNIFISNRGLSISSKNVGKLYICDEEDIQNEKSFQILNNSRILGKQCQSLYNCNHVTTPTREISKSEGKLIHESAIRGLGKILSSSTDDFLIPNLASLGENDSLKTKDFIMSSAQFLSENQEKLRSLLTYINEQCCSEKSHDARYEELYSVTSNDSEEEICVFSTSDNSNDLDKVSNTLSESRLSSSANTLKNNDANENGQRIKEISNKPASSKKPDHASIDEKSNNCSESFTPDKRDSLEIKNTNHRSSDDYDSSDTSLSKDCSFVAISVASLDTPPQSDVSNISREDETTDTSVHDNSADFLAENDNSEYIYENYENSMYTSETSSDYTTDSYETENTSNSDMSLTDCSEEENCSRSYQIYTTDSSMNDDLTKSLLNDFANASINLDNSLSKNDNLTYLSFKEGVSSASLNNSDESSPTKTSKLYEESCQGTEFETSKAKLNIPTRNSKSSSPAKMSDESQKCEVDSIQTLIVATTENIKSINSSDNNEEKNKNEFKYDIVESNSDSKICDVAVDAVDSQLDEI